MCFVMKLLPGGMGSKIYTSLLIIICFPSFKRLYGNYHEFFFICLLTIYTLVRSNVTSLYCQLKLKNNYWHPSRWHRENFRKSCHHQWFNQFQKKKEHEKFSEWQAYCVSGLKEQPELALKLVSENLLFKFNLVVTKKKHFMPQAVIFVFISFSLLIIL